MTTLMSIRTRLCEQNTDFELEIENRGHLLAGRGEMVRVERAVSGEKTTGL